MNYTDKKRLCILFLIFVYIIFTFVYCNIFDMDNKPPLQDGDSGTKGYNDIFISPTNKDKFLIGSNIEIIWDYNVEQLEGADIISIELSGVPNGLTDDIKIVDISLDAKNSGIFEWNISIDFFIAFGINYQKGKYSIVIRNPKNDYKITSDYFTISPLLITETSPNYQGDEFLSEDEQIVFDYVTAGLPSNCTSEFFIGGERKFSNDKGWSSIKQITNEIVLDTDTGKSIWSVPSNFFNNLDVIIDQNGFEIVEKSFQIKIRIKDASGIILIEDYTSKVSIAKQKECLMMFYVNCDNQTEGLHFQTLNYIEMGLHDLGGVYDNKMAILVLVDRNKGQDTSNGDWTGARLYKMTTDNTDENNIKWYYDENDHNNIVSIDLKYPDSNGVATYRWWEDWLNYYNLSCTPYMVDNDPELNMGDSSNLEAYISFCRDKFPYYSHHIFKIYAHGGSTNYKNDDIDFEAYKLQDYTNGFDKLKNYEIKNALMNAGYNSSNKLDIIELYLCYQGTIEIAYQFRDIASYFKGIPCKGPLQNSTTVSRDLLGNFNNVFDSSGNFSTEKYIKQLIKSLNKEIYLYHYDEPQFLLPAWVSYIILSLNESEIFSLKNEIDNLSNELNKECLVSGMPDFEKINLIRDIKEYGVSKFDLDGNCVFEGMLYPYFDTDSRSDIASLCYKIIDSEIENDNLKKYAENIINKLKTIIKYSKKHFPVDNAFFYEYDFENTPDTLPYGLAIHFNNPYSWYSNTSGNYLDFCTSTNDGVVNTWKEFLVAWGSYWSNHRNFLTLVPPSSIIYREADVQLCGNPGSFAIDAPISLWRNIGNNVNFLVKDNISRKYTIPNSIENGSGYYFKIVNETGAEAISRKFSIYDRPIIDTPDDRLNIYLNIIGNSGTLSPNNPSITVKNSNIGPVKYQIQSFRNWLKFQKKTITGNFVHYELVGTLKGKTDENGSEIKLHFVFNGTIYPRLPIDHIIMNPPQREAAPLLDIPVSNVNDIIPFLKPEDMQVLYERPAISIKGTDMAYNTVNSENVYIVFNIQTNE